ncbi:hypothetical protein COCVIDRAFT_91262 [Bipolaris victoriae FI3]|uniref:Uncharacterized protein n=1 Tax=Bipolaris victoriae (strain FI3) TaxID=930091 RepID=W7EW70_BIPV3|nr:hypothetical protein COCVIDRAFT_91262 [Bipolaris victoriae FI3]
MPDFSCFDYQADIHAMMPGRILGSCHLMISTDMLMHNLPCQIMPICAQP